MDLTEEGYKLKHTSAKDTQHPITKLFEREALRIWYERYEKERLGFLDFKESLNEKTSIPIPKQVSEQLQEAIADRTKNLILIRAYPDVKPQRLPACWIPSPSSFQRPFFRCRPHEVKKDHLSQSG